MNFPWGSIAAVIPTRGDVDIRRLAQHLRQFREFGFLVFSPGPSSFTRYAIGRELNLSYFYTQDDDCVTDIAPLLEAYEPGDRLFNAMTAHHQANYPGRETLLGFGTICQTSLIKSTFDRPWVRDQLFFRECDRIFGSINRHASVHCPIEVLPEANAPNRYWRSPDHVSSRDQMRRRIFETTGIRWDGPND